MNDKNRKAAIDAAMRELYGTAGPDADLDANAIRAILGRVYDKGYTGEKSVRVRWSYDKYIRKHVAYDADGDVVAWCRVYKSGRYSGYVAGAELDTPTLREFKERAEQALPQR